MAVLCACNMETNVGWSPSQGLSSSHRLQNNWASLKTDETKNPHHTKSKQLRRQGWKKEWMGVKYANTCREAYPHTYFMWFFLTLTRHWFQEKFNNQILHLSIKLGRFSVLLFRNFETVFFFTILLPPYHFSCNPAMWTKKTWNYFVNLGHATLIVP